jgi:hypothetical protein
LQFIILPLQLSGSTQCWDQWDVDSPQLGCEMQSNVSEAPSAHALCVVMRHALMRASDQLYLQMSGYEAAGAGNNRDFDWFTYKEMDIFQAFQVVNDF